MTSFTILILPIHKHERSFHLLISSPISFFRDLNFLLHSLWLALLELHKDISHYLWLLWRVLFWWSLTYTILFSVNRDILNSSFPICSTPSWPMHNLLLPDCLPIWVPVLVSLDDEQWYGNVGQINSYSLNSSLVMVLHPSSSHPNSDSHLKHTHFKILKVFISDTDTYLSLNKDHLMFLMIIMLVIWDGPRYGVTQHYNFTWNAQDVQILFN